MFGVEILNDFFLAIVLLEPGWKQHIHTMYKTHQGVMHQCLFVLPKISTFRLFYEGFCLKFPGHLHYSDVRFSMVPKLLQFYLVFTIHIFRNSCKCCALIIAVFKVGCFHGNKVFVVNLWGTSIIFTWPRYVAVSNQNSFKTPCMHMYFLK